MAEIIRDEVTGQDRDPRRLQHPEPHRADGPEELDPREGPERAATGVIEEAVNPKVVLFFLAFLPQFVQGARGGIGWQTAQLGVVFTLQSAILFGAIGYSAGTIGAWLARKPRAGVWLDRIAGGIFSTLGLRLIVAR
ncbi:MAG TPA: LysE family translocator [Anaeromyxobacteraceae bacterium]|nr:LysE family translocator [Anaeromyxobacteraceae bacterium]